MDNKQYSVTRSLARLIYTVALLLFIAVAVRAERLPVKTYTTADGLVSDRISRIVRDPRGFLWFCTEHGLSRFDGYRFVNYTTDQGLPDNWVDDLLITRDGQYWVATEGGLCRFNPNAASAPLFVTYRPSPDEIDSRIKVLLEDRAGVIWCGTWKGLYRLEVAGEQVSFHRVELGLPANETTVIRNILEDRRGDLWVTSHSGLFRLLPGGRVERYTTQHGLPDNNLMGLLEDHEGRLWVGTRHSGLCLLVPDVNRAAVARRYTLRDGLPCDSIVTLFRSSGGRFWVGTDCGLSEMLPGDDKNPAFRSYASAEALRDLNIWCLAEDGDGNLWVGSPGGAIKVALRGLTTYTTADGLSGNVVTGVFETQAGALLVNVHSPDGRRFDEFDGRRFTRAGLVTSTPYGILQDRAGEWWTHSPAGLYRFPRVGHIRDLARVRPLAIYTRRDGLPGYTLLNLYEDARGDIWIALPSRPQGWLTRWERATGRFHNYSEADGLPLADGNAVSAYCDDRAGNLWLGFFGGGLARYREGRFQTFAVSDGVPGGLIRSLLVDRDGRLWVASSQGGVGRLDDVTAERPAFVRLTTAEGLSSNDALCLTDDAQGRVYIGTTRGLDRLDPADESIRHYTTADGLANQTINIAYRDRHGALWFGTNTGLTRMIPEPDAARSPPVVLISGLRISGEDHSVAALGETGVGGLELGPAQNNLSIEFFGFSFSEPLRYQYKLESVNSDWSAPAPQRAVDYPSLSSGSYRFLARAVNAAGLTSPHPASVTFTILPPVWQRWWFLTLGALLAGSLLYGAYRYRVAQLIRVERVRTRIATDLHDDIGANLSLIAGLSDLLRRQVGQADFGAGERLAQIASLSSRSVEAMSDIIWAVNPKRDNLGDLAQRMRRFAGDAFAVRDIEFAFRAPDPEQHTKIGAEARREIFLLFKEAVNNAARHSACARAEVILRVESGQVVLQVKDDGKGFEQNGADGGNGLMSMRERAARLGGRLEIVSQVGRGTTVTLKAPLRR